MLSESIHRFYTYYIKNIKQLHELEQNLIDNVNDENEFKYYLIKKAEFTKQFYDQAATDYNHLVLPFINDPSSLTFEIIDIFLKEIYEFTTTNLYDQILTTNILFAILKKLDQTDSIERRIVTYHFIAVHIEQINTKHYIKESAAYFHKLTQYESYLYTNTNTYVKSCIVKSYYNYIMREIEYPDEGDLNEVLRITQACERVYSNPDIRQELNGLFDFDGFSAVINQMLFERLSYFKDQCSNDLYDYLYQKYNVFVSTTEQQICSQKRLTAPEFSIYYHNKFMMKEISASEFIDRCIEYIDAIPIPDPDDDAQTFFHSDYFLSVQAVGINIISAFASLTEITEKQQNIKKRTLASIRHTLMNIPRINELRSYTDRAIYDTTKLLAPYISEVEITDWITQFAVTRQTTTAIHSRMVANISIALLDHIAHEHEDVLKISFPSFEEYNKHREKILRYMYECGLYHDIGKARISNIVKCDYRRLTDAEFNAIKEHPSLGYNIACESKYLYKYRTIIEGHHKYYNDNGGYPNHFTREGHHLLLLRDILSIADSLDAATDMYGRNYHQSKSVETVLQEFIDDKGKQYNPQIVKCIADCPDFTNYLKRVCGEEQRFQIIRRVYIAQEDKSHKVNMEYKLEKA